jgi:hypothetical protein
MKEPLFSSHDLGDALRRQQQQMIDEINQMQPDYLLNVSTENVFEYLVEKYRVNVPQLQEDKITMDVDDHWETSRDRFDGTQYRQPGTVYSFFLPFQGDREIFKCRPSSYSFNPPQGEIKSNELIFTYFRPLVGLSGREEQEADEVRKSFQNELERAKGYLNSTTKDVDRFHPTLFDLARQQIEFRKTKFLKDRGIGTALGFPLRKRDGVPTTYAVPTVRKQLPTRPPASTAAYKPEPVLEMEHYEHILSVISSMVKVMEQSPSAFKGMDEENLRQHFLVQLNGHYQGQATGETFNFEGKTDILIRVEGKNIFIAECKFWHGPKKLAETIDQLLGYTSWRDTKTAIVIFNRNKEFSTVLAKIPEVITAHPNYKKTLSQASETQFHYTFNHRDDPNRELLLTVLAFEVPG